MKTVRDVHDYLRGVLTTKELSARVFELNTDAVHLNPANYTVWSVTMYFPLYLSLFN